MELQCSLEEPILSCSEPGEDPASEQCSQQWPHISGRRRQCSDLMTCSSVNQRSEHSWKTADITRKMSAGSSRQQPGRYIFMTVISRYNFRKINEKVIERKSLRVCINYQCGVWFFLLAEWNEMSLSRAKVHGVSLGWGLFLRSPKSKVCIYCKQLQNVEESAIFLLGFPFVSYHKMYCKSKQGAVIGSFSKQ